MNAIQKYFKKRQHLIDQFLKGDLSKNEYLRENYNAVLGLKLQPFKNIDTLEKGLFNYQYYNAMAKDAKITSFSYDDYQLRSEFVNESDYYYYKKDRATLQVLKILDYRNVHAYFIQVKSKYLRGKLFEIVIEEQGMILHSTNTSILMKLREELVFVEEVKRSLIDYYWRVKSSIKNKNIANARYCGILELIKDKEDAIGSGLQK